MSPRTQHLDAWRRSAAWREIARRQCLKMNAAHAAKPRCDAVARTTGERCRRPAMASGKCRFHGGATPRGKAWHRPRFPEKDVPGAVDKINRKAADLAKRARKRAKRLASMTPEQRADHDRWHATHRPGDPKKRAATRERRRQDREAAARIAGWQAEDDKPRSAKAAAIDAELAELRAELAARRAELETPTGGIFD